MNSTRRYLPLLLALAFALFGCQQQFDDISSDKNYTHLINETYQSLQVLRLHGVTQDRNYAKLIDYYAVTALPGMSGPEIVSVRALDAGSVFEIEQILRCNNCLLTSPVVISINILSENLPPEVPIKLYRLRVEGADGRVELDPDYFRVL